MRPDQCLTSLGQVADEVEDEGEADDVVFFLALRG